MLRRVVRVIAAGSVAAAMFACGGSSDNSTGPVTPVFTSVSVSPAGPSVAIGDSVALTASGKSQTGAAMSGLPAATWSSSDATKVSVNSTTGVATGQAAGTATITASITSGSTTHTGTTVVTVAAPAAQTGSVAATNAIVFDPTTITVNRHGASATVTWSFGTTAHTVSFNSEPTGASVNDIDATASGSVGRNFSVAGTYTYHCSIHPTMTGTVVVQ